MATVKAVFSLDGDRHEISSFMFEYYRNYLRNVSTFNVIYHYRIDNRFVSSAGKDNFPDYSKAFIY